MVSVYEKALKRMWVDRCTIIAKEKVTDRESKLTQFMEKVLAEGVPCRLSFSQLTTTNGDPVAAIGQSIKLFLPASIAVPPGSKIIVKRKGEPGQELIYSRSGEPGLYPYHQEIILTSWKGWA